MSARPGPLNLITDVPGITVGNAEDRAALTGVTQVTAGANHSCARLSNGEARCWGDNEDGQLGDGTTTNRTRPVRVSNATGANAQQNVRKISAGTRSAAGRRCRDTFISLKKTCRKHGISFWEYLCDRVAGRNQIPQLPDLIEQAAAPA